MNALNPIKSYPPLEEKFNVISHAIGLILSLIALVLLVGRAYVYGDFEYLLSFTIFGVSLVVLYAASTFYHMAEKADRRIKLRIFDHASIYILIAGTYTPFTLLVLKSPTGWMIFGVVWVLAIAGIILKLFFTGRFKFLSDRKSVV